MRNVRTWVAWSIAAGVLLVSPVLAFLMVMAAEMAVDGLMEMGVTEASAIAIGVVGCVLFRRILRSETAQLSGSKEVCEALPIAAPPG
jgi:hypothetical protein